MGLCIILMVCATMVSVKCQAGLRSQTEQTTTTPAPPPLPTPPIQQPILPEDNQMTTSQPLLMENDETTTFQMETQVPDSTDQPPTTYLEDMDEEIDTRIENTTYTNIDQETVQETNETTPETQGDLADELQFLGSPIRKFTTTSEDLRQEQLAKYGIKKTRLQAVTTHLTMITLWSVLDTSAYKADIQKITEVISQTSDELQRAQVHLKTIINETILSKISNPSDLLQFCKGRKLKPANINRTNFMAGCRAINMYDSIQYLSDNTEKLYKDAIYRIDKIEKNIGEFEVWMSAEQEIPLNSQNKKHDKNKQRRSTHEDINILGTMFATALGVPTYDDLGSIHLALTTQNTANIKIITAAENTALLLDIQNTQIEHLNSAVIDLQEIAKTSAQRILTSATIENLQQTIHSSTISSLTANTIYTKAHNILSDISISTQILIEQFQAAINRELSVKLINPHYLYNLLKSFQKRLPKKMNLLWGLHPKHPEVYYSQIKTKMFKGEPPATAIIEFQIPIVDQTNEFIHFRIDVAPFLIVQNHTTFKVQMRNLPTSTHILIPTSQNPAKEIYYQIPYESINIGHPKNMAATLNIRRMDTLNREQSQCIDSIIKNKIDKITTDCGIETSQINSLIHRITATDYIYFYKEKTEITIQCPNQPDLKNQQRHNQVKTTLHIQNFGSINADSRCDIVTPETRFIGAPLNIAEHEIKLKSPIDNRFENFKSINLTMWTNILETQNSLNLDEMTEIVKTIEEITSQFQPQLKGRVNRKLNNLKKNIQQAKEANKLAWYAIQNIKISPQRMLALIAFLTIIITGILIYLLCKAQIWKKCCKPSPIMARTQESEEIPLTDQSDTDQLYTEIIRRTQTATLNSLAQQLS